MSSPSDFDDLLQAEIDGGAGKAERAALFARLAVDPAAGEDLRRQAAVGAALDAVEPVAPPAGLVEEIMRRVRSEKAIVPRGLLARIRAAWPSGRPLISYAYAAAAGAALCFVAVESLGGGSPLGRSVATGEAVGTMGEPSSIRPRSVVLEAGAVHGSVLVRSEGGRDALDVQFQGPSPVDVVMRFDPSEAVFAGIDDPVAGLDRVTAVAGEVRWSQAPGRRVSVRLTPRGAVGATVRFGVESGGNRLDAGIVRLGEGR